MCFSAEASFPAATVLGAMGAYSLWRTQTPRDSLFRAIPLLFAVHQFVEGMIWRAWAVRTSWRLDSWLIQLWLLVALAIWPVWIPLSCTLLERRRSHRTGLAALAVAGGVFGAWLMTHALARGAWSCVLRGHFYHSVQLTRPMQPVAQVLYLSFVIGPLLIVRASNARQLGVAMFVAWCACAWIYRTTMISVWCFFAAWLSVMVLRVETPVEEHALRQGVAA